MERAPILMTENTKKPGYLENFGKLHCTDESPIDTKQIVAYLIGSQGLPVQVSVFSTFLPLRAVGNLGARHFKGTFSSD